MIGGKLDARAYALLAQLHKPTGENGMRDAARELARRGLSEREIGETLGVDASAVRRLLAASDSEAAAVHAQRGQGEVRDSRRPAMRELRGAPMTRLAWMPLFAGDHIAETRALSLTARGALIDLLMLSWTSGPLPDDPDRLAAMIGATPREWRDLWPSIAKWWTKTDAGLVHAPLEERRVQARKAYGRRVENALASARKRKGNRSGEQ
jgi:uncharacterized protein YdaU (DUF1376 family)